MTLQEIVRRQTQEIRDALSLVERKHADLSAGKDAAEDSLKRAATEITKHRHPPDRVDQENADQEERQRRAAATAALKKARHEERRIGDLCDQREQFRQLFSMATVPGVKETIEKALRKIEDELQRLYPDALGLESIVTDPGFIEEVHFFADIRGKASILLPVDTATVEAIEKGDTSPGSRLRVEG